MRENPPATGTCRKAYMAITLIPVEGFVQSQASPVLELEVGAYGWKTIDTADIT